MNSSPSVELFDRLGKIPNAIPRLRHFILDLAVRGRLVRQVTSGEHVEQLLCRIRKEKSLWVKEGKLRVRAETAQDQDQPPYRLPSSWSWCRLSDVGAIIGGGTPPSGDEDNFLPAGSGIPWLTPADLGKQTDLYVSHGARDLSEKGLRSSSATLLPKGSVLFTSRAPIGYTAIAATNISTNQGFKSVVPFVPECNRYIAIYFLAFARWIDSQASGTTFREVSGKTVAALPFPLPPIKEQNQIVAKVDELLTLCDSLEAALAERRKRKASLVAASLHRLTSNASAKDLQENARFCLDKLPILIDEPEAIRQMRSAVLSLAVQGRLVKRDPKDQSAPSFGISDASTIDRINMRLPEGWSWATVANVAEARLGKMLDIAKNSGKSFRYLRNTNVHWFDIRIDDLKEIKLRESEVDRYTLAKGDVLICEGGHGIGRTAVWRETNDCIVFQKALHRVRTGPALDPDFFSFCMFVYFHTGILQGYFTGVGIPHFTGKALARLVFPLPPISEQRRIVEKVNQVMSLCDSLEQRLAQNTTGVSRLMEAVLHHALNDGVADLTVCLAAQV